MNRSDGSLTARAVCLARGLAGVDPYAEAMLAGWWGRGLLALPRLPRRLMGPLTGGFIATVGGRTRFIDRVLTEALGAGAAQLVLLGAGFDARPWRFAPLLGARPVYLIDHPATAAARARVAAALPPRDDVRVDVDFATERFDTRLRDAGFDPSRPAMVVWEGVSMYLPEAAVRATLDRLGALLAPGSRLAFDLWSPDDRASALLGQAGRVGLGWLGEPLDFGCRRAAIPDLLGPAGWTVRSVRDARDEGAAFGGLGWPGLVFVDATL